MHAKKAERKNFDVLVLNPAGWTRPALAAAAARGGGVGVLDLECCRDAAQARENFNQLLRLTTARIGLRFSANERMLARELMALAGLRALTLVFCGDQSKFAGIARAHDTALAEVTDDQLDPAASDLNGVIVKGCEAGLWGGEDSSYILAQKWLAKTNLPVYVRGAGGVHSAAALAAGGAAGVVLDDQVLLLEESALTEAQKNELARLNGAETRVLGESLGTPCRVYARPANASLKAAEAETRAAEAGETKPAQWREQLQARIGWAEGELMPLGQSIGVADIYRERYGRLARLLRAIVEAVDSRVADALRLAPLAPGSALAQSHGTEYPLVQGPMTRVSDHAGFAAAVAGGGALPMLALALMRREQVSSLLEETRALVGDKPWGVGILGFVPEALRAEQAEAVFENPPPFALIAGGRPDQAQEFENRGIATYIHAPAPELLRLYLEQGSTRFVFEGRECGGHIGPIASFPLWEQMIEVLLKDVKPGSEENVHVLFAGGLSDARSGAMLAALTAPLAARGMKIGGLMGTAYLFTQEIVAAGAIVPGFQQEALACRKTASLESGPGHSTRCADTSFAREFMAERRRLLKEKLPAEEIRDQLEDLNLGRLRIASKGLNRDDKGAIVPVDEKRQRAEGLYMIGQVATLTHSVQPIAALHDNVCRGAQDLLAERATHVSAETAEGKPSDIAIIGIGCLLPKSMGADSFWNKVVQQVVVTSEVPKSRWDWRLYFDADRDARDKIYSKWGGFLDEFVFDPTRYGIPPASMKSIDPMQLLALEATSRALADAGYADGKFDRERTAVILGSGGGVGDLGMQYGVRSELPRFVANPDPAVWDRLPEWTNESFAGTLQNVAAGRIANRLDLGGVNFTVDAACASSLAAVALAVSELESGRASMAIAGGVDTVQGPHGFMCFSKTQALSPDGRTRAFDKDANGIVISEGVAMVVLKRLADAERDGDRIYAVIKAVAGSSDGKALGMTAPRPDGQIRALDRAYAKAGFKPDSLGLIEAHGTGTPVGDRAEAETVTRALRSYGAAPRTTAIGSVKTLVGHTKCVAGLVGMTKVALSLHHRVLPAHSGVEKPLDALAENDSPVYLLKNPRPWLARDGQPRRGAVSAFGFGGTNFHAVLEEYRDGLVHAEPAGATDWPWELIVLRAADAGALQQNIATLTAALTPDSALKLAELSLALALAAEKQLSAPVVAAFACRDLAGLRADLEALAANLQSNKPLPPHIKLTQKAPAEQPKAAFLFPGQGAQYVGMACEAALYLEPLRAAMEQSQAALNSSLPQPLSRYVWPEGAFSPEDESQQQRALTDTRVAQPAIGAVSLGYLRLAQQLGIEAAATAGHSYGEYTALHAAGVIDTETFLRLSAVRGAAMAQASDDGRGGMAAVNAPRAEVEARLAQFPGVKLANHNGPTQSVISGPADAVNAAVEAFSAAGLRAMALPVSGAFHTSLVASAQAPLSAAITAAKFNAPDVPVYSNTSGQQHAGKPGEIKNLLNRHLLSAVEFVSELEAMHADGMRVFIELGPKSICTGLVNATLGSKADVRAIALDGQGGGLRGLLTGLADLLTAGVRIDLAALYEGRDLEALDLSRLAQLAQPAAPPRTAWMLSGGCARPLNDPQLRTGKAMQLDLETKNATVAAAPQVAATAAPAAVAAPVMTMPAAMPATAGGGLAMEALMAYQQTMRQFLALQEKVMSQFLAGGAALPSAMPAMTMPAMPQAVVAAPVVAAAPVQAPVAAPVVVAAPVAAPAAVVIDRASLQVQLLGIVAERTGYPADMLKLDADLEADLGVDSIKRVEIIGAFRKQQPAALSQAMQAKIEQYTRAKTLKAILDALEPHLHLVTAAAAPVANVEAPAVAPAVAVAVPAVSLETQLLAIVAERTGYPADMLKLDADLEADLGIDSIKRVEIIGAFRKQQPAAVSQAMQAQIERYTRAKTLAAILAAMPKVDAAPAEPVVVSAPVEVKKPEPVAAPAKVTKIPRYVLRSVQAPLTGRTVALQGLTLLLGGEGTTVLQNLTRDLKARGLKPVHIEAIEAEELRKAIAAARKQHGAVRAVLDLHGLQQREAASMEEWHAHCRRCFLPLFHSAQTLSADLDGVRVIAATRLGGSFGRDAVGSGVPLAGGINGLLNCLRLEYPKSQMRCVDFDGQTEPEIARLLAIEVFADDVQPEAGYIGVERYGAVTAAQPLHENPFQAQPGPSADWVVLATGGARGITAEILRELAVPGMRLVLLGRSAEPAAEDTTMAALDAAGLRKALLSQKLARGEKPRPVDIDREVARVLADREIGANLAKLRATGAAVEYVACDVRDENAFGGLLDGLYKRHGRIDAVLHGAGVIEDKLIADKSVESFERVIGTKLDAAYILMSKLRPDSLKLLVFFTSVAGRYGNRGQADYATANEALNRLAWDLHRRWTGTRVMAINWGPWAGGMASEAVQRALRERGMEPIPVAAGCRFLAEEIAYGPRNDVELVAGAGPWGLPAAAVPAAPVEETGPQLRGTPQLGVGGALVLEQRFSAKTDEWLREHGAGALTEPLLLEWMTQFVEAGWPGQEVVELREMRRFKSIVPEKGECHLWLRAKASTHSDPSGQRVSVEILDGTQKTVHYRATALLQGGGSQKVSAPIEAA